MDNLGGTTIIRKTTHKPNNAGRVDLVRNDFDNLIYQKGYEVYLDKAVQCPCRTKVNGQPLSNCKNCGGSGWLFINRKKTRMVIQSINRDTKFKDWRTENLGQAKVSTLSSDRLGYMDRITVLSGTTNRSTTLHFNKINGQGRYVAMVIHPIVKIEELFLFVSPDSALQRLTLDEHFTITNKNWITLDEQYDNLIEPTCSIRYTYNPMFHVIDLTREVMNSTAIEKGKESNFVFPTAAIARSAHYVLDEDGYSGDVLIDNSYSNQC